MISDPRYDLGYPLITPKAGILTGLAASVMMTGLIFLMQPITGFYLSEFFAQVGSIAVPQAFQIEKYPVLMLIGVGIHFLVGAFWGLIYAFCQMRIRQRWDIIGVGISYGLTIWVVNCIFIPLRSIFCSWPMPLICLCYGFSVAGIAIWFDQHSPKPSLQAVQMD